LRDQLPLTPVVNFVRKIARPHRIGIAGPHAQGNAEVNAPQPPTRHCEARSDEAISRTPLLRR
jgi:hypothetical protein